MLLCACLASASAVFVGCGGAVFQGDDDDAGGQGAVGGSSGNGGSSGSSGSAGKGSGGSSGSAGSGGGGSGASGGTSGRGGSGGGGAGGVGASGGSGGSGNTGNEGGTAGMGASGGSGNTGNEGGTGNTSGSSASGGGGNGGTEQWAEDYDQGCEYDYNCSLVQQGDKCACPTCNYGAVNHGVVEQYQSDWAAIMCPMGEPVCPENACAEQLASCTESGKCYVRVPTYIDGANYPKTCQQPSDCHFIYTGEVCSSCKCGTAAVNREGYDQYLAEIESIDCTPSPSTCDCAAPEQVTCLLDVNSVMGQCVMGDGLPVSE